MYFIFSKLLFIFILPLNWILALLIASLIVKNKAVKKRLVIISVALLFFCSAPFFLNHFEKWWDINPVSLNNKKTYSCVIVLGGFSGEDANGNGIFSAAADRFIQGLKLITNHKASHILITGGSGALIPDKFIEADWVKTQLRDFNVPDSAILIEDRSRNTIENAAFSKIVLAKSKLQPPYLLVTSAFHMRRSLGIFKKAKIEVVPVPCNYLTQIGQTTFEELLPDANILYKWGVYIKEMIGAAVDY